MTQLVQYCEDTDFNATTQTCAAPYWGPASTGFPALSISDAQAIASAMCPAWGTAWIFRRIKRFLDQS